MKNAAVTKVATKAKMTKPWPRKPSAKVIVEVDKIPSIDSSREWGTPKGVASFKLGAGSSKC